MGRWTQYDEDEYRLGMKRVGYDADTQRYYYRNDSGAIWAGAEGAEYGEMTRVSNIPTSISNASSSRSDSDIEAAPASSRSDGYQLLTADPSRTMAHKAQINTGAYRTLFPFFLIIAVVLLLIWRLILYPGLSVPTKKCPEGTKAYWVQPGDSCWEISNAHKCSFEKFKELNPKVECDPLMPGTSVCLPPS